MADSIGDGTEGGGRVTSYDVARLAGVSQSAVSRAFRDGASISSALRARVQRAARELGYAPSNIARALITQRSRLIGVLVTETTTRNTPDILFHLGHEIQQAGSRMLVFTLAVDRVDEDGLRDLLSFDVDGVIAATTLAEDTLELCARRGLPVVLYNRHSPAGQADSVGCDSASGMRLLAAHLRQGGTRDAAFLAGPRGAPVSEDRLAAARAAFASCDMSLRPAVHADYSHASGRQAAPGLLAPRRRPDTIVCANDAMALGVIDACRHDLGLAVPGDVAVTGFDDVAQASWPAYALTTLAQPIAEQTRMAVRMIVERIEDSSPARERRLLLPRLVIRGSTRGGHDGDVIGRSGEGRKEGSKEALLS